MCPFLPNPMGKERRFKTMARWCNMRQDDAFCKNVFDFFFLAYRLCDFALTSQQEKQTGFRKINSVCLNDLRNMLAYFLLGRKGWCCKTPTLQLFAQQEKTGGVQLMQRKKEHRGRRNLCFIHQVLHFKQWRFCRRCKRWICMGFVFFKASTSQASFLALISIWSPIAVSELENFFFLFNAFTGGGKGDFWLKFAGNDDFPTL